MSSYGAAAAAGNVNRNMKSGLCHGLSQFFSPSEDEEMESAPQEIRNKWKDQHSSASTDDFRDSKWQDIPMELLVRILALVDFRTVLVASGVCTGWRDAMSIGVLELSFSWCGKSVSKLVQSVAPKFSRLQSCNLRRCTLLNDQAIEALASHCHELVSLDLSNGISKGTRLTDVSLVALSKGCRRLQKLDLSGCIGITEAGLVALAESCSELKHLNLCGCDNACLDKALMAIAHNCSGLQILNAGWCDKITDVGITALAMCCPDLRGLDLCGCHHITDRSIVALAERCYRLRFLGLYCCRNVTDLSMYALVNSRKYRMIQCTNSSSSHNKSSSSTSSSSSVVTRSSTGSCSNSSSNNSNSSCSSSNNSSDSNSNSYVHLLLHSDQCGLVSLNLSGCTALSGRAVQAVCDAFPALHTCPEKHSLNVSGCTNLTTVHCQCRRST